MNAYEIMYKSRDASYAVSMAEDLDPLVTQGPNGATLYTFDDGSVLAICESQVKAYDDASDYFAD